MTRLRALHVAPHPDDEAVGCMGTITHLIDAGWEVTNLVTTLGRPGQEERRQREAEAAGRTGGYEVVVAPDTIVSAGYDAFEDRLLRHLLTVLTALRPDLVLAPSPHDGHPRHEAVGRAVARASHALPGTRWWMYSIWTDLALPTLYVEVDEARMRRSLDVLSQYEGELSRQDYRDLVAGRARTARILGSEKIFGFGTSSVSPAPFAELITEVVSLDDDWFAGPPRVLDLSKVAEPATDQRLGTWLDRRSDLDALSWRRTNQATLPTRC